MHLENSPAVAPDGPDAARAEPATGVLLAILIIATLLPRLAVFTLNENLHGDAVARTELAQQWAADPHWIASFKDGAYQFGPLHIYAVGVALWAGLPKEDAGRWVSLLFGVLSVVPLFSLSRRLFGWKSGLVAGLGLAAWGIHIQLSTVAASEALALFLVLCTLAWFARGWEEGRVRPLFAAAFFLNLACATRYEAWLLIPLLTLLLALGDRDRIAAITRAVIFGFACTPFPAIWMEGNETATGSPFYPVQFIQHFHDTWAAAGVGTYGEIGFRLQNLFFWPGTALLTLTPLVAAFGVVGMVSAWRRFPRARWLVWVVAVPTAYFTFRAAVLADFVPLGRFTVNQVGLLLPFVATGFVAVTHRLAQPMRWGLVGVSALLAVALPLWLGLFTYKAEEGTPVTLSPVSPVATNPPAVMHAARVLKEQIAPTGESVVIDADPKYMDMQLAFFSGLPEERLVRVRWKNFDQRFAELRPGYIVRFEGGELEKRADFDSRDHRVQLGEDWYEEILGLRPPMKLYGRVRGPEVPPATGTASDRLNPVSPAN
ncbi:MAG: glycosyltransferase family 39 protein [Myxococcaceae bacterium]|nr:glycosyltransferase family 39 protein [Myxococcaceae bacterium]